MRRAASWRLARRGVATLGGELARGLCGLLGLFLAGGAAAGELVGDLPRRGVDERAGPEHHLGGLELRQRGTTLGQLAQALGRHVARETALELDQLPEVRREHRALEVALDEHHHRLVAEVALEVIGGLSDLRRGRDERVRARPRLEPEREHAAGQPKCGHDRDHHQRPPGDGAHDGCESLSPHASQLRELRVDRTQLRNTPGLARHASERRLGAARRRGRVAPSA